MWVKAKSVQELAENPNQLFKRYLSQLANSDVSAATQNQAFNALVFLFEKVIGVKLGDLSGITRATRQEKFIDVPMHDQALSLVKSARGKPGLALRLIYGTAMRINDCLRLRVKDIDFNRNQIAVQESKGGKARLVPLPESLAPELKLLIAERERTHESDLAAGFGWVHMPHKLAIKYPGEQKSLGWQYVFASQKISTDPRTNNRGRHHILDIVVQAELRETRQRLRFKRRFTVHSLRHAAAQFWEKSGVPISDIQQLLGHTSIETTQRYLRSGKRGVPKVPTPI